MFKSALVKYGVGIISLAIYTGSVYVYVKYLNSELDGYRRANIKMVEQIKTLQLNNKVNSIFIDAYKEPIDIEVYKVKDDNTSDVIVYDFNKVKD